MCPFFPIWSFFFYSSPNGHIICLRVDFILMRDFHAIEGVKYLCVDFILMCDFILMVMLVYHDFDFWLIFHWRALTNTWWCLSSFFKFMYISLMCRCVCFTFFVDFVLFFVSRKSFVLIGQGWSIFLITNPS
jgi:hypothetical protein